MLRYDAAAADVITLRRDVARCHVLPPLVATLLPYVGMLMLLLIIARHATLITLLAHYALSFMPHTLLPVFAYADAELLLFQLIRYADDFQLRHAAAAFAMPLFDAVYATIIAFAVIDVDGCCCFAATRLYAAMALRYAASFAVAY